MESLTSFPVGDLHPLQHAGLSRRTAHYRRGAHRSRHGPALNLHESQSWTVFRLTGNSRASSRNFRMADHTGGSQATGNSKSRGGVGPAKRGWPVGCSRWGPRMTLSMFKTKFLSEEHSNIDLGGTRCKLYRGLAKKKCIDLCQAEDVIPSY